MHERVPTLYSYTITHDDGAAPNPFGGMCSLAICKPGIRKAAKVGDWIAGLGSVNAPSGNLSSLLIYAMRVDEVLTLQQYDSQAKERWPERIPNAASFALQERLGDCIYDYSSGEAQQRHGVHGPQHMKKDLSGRNVLLSWDFYYYGNRAIPLPIALRGILHQTQGFKSDANDELMPEFVNWIRSLGKAPGQIGWPDRIPMWDHTGGCEACTPNVPVRKRGCDGH
jgi:hypothetical protein